MKAVIYRQDRTADARLIASGIREDFIRLKGRVSVLDTVVPHAKAALEAATLRIPVHRHEPRRDGVMPSASTVMHQLAWELIPSLCRAFRPATPPPRNGRHERQGVGRRAAATGGRVVARRKPGNNARDLAGQVDPRTESQIELAVDEIQPYEHNPRRATNAKFDDIKESIRTSGLREARSP